MGQLKGTLGVYCEQKRSHIFYPLDQIADEKVGDSLVRAKI